MFKFCSLFSGSTGNSLFVETENSKILVDAGESAKKIVSALSLIGIEVTDIDAILVTHEHIDHVKSLGTLSKNIIFRFMQMKILGMPCQNSKQKF